MAKKRTYREFKQGLYNPLNPAKCLNKTPPEYRSGLERKLMSVLDKNPNVIQWSSEKVIVPYKHPIKTAKAGIPTFARYFVDFYMKIKIGEVIKEFLIEVKPLRQCSKPEPHGNKKPSTILYENVMWAINQAKWEAATKFCIKKNYKFIIINEENINQILSS
jgi:hypothetical protein